MTTFEIRASIGVAGIGAADLRTALESRGAVRIVLDSGGGSCRSGAALADMIDAHGLPVEIHRAVSAAALVATAGPSRSIAADGYIGTHPVWRAIAGGAAELSAAARQLRKTDELLARLLAQRSRLSEKEAARAIRGGRRWTAEEAIADGLADQIAPAAGLMSPIPDSIVDGPCRENLQLREAAEHHQRRAVLERSISTAGTAGLEAVESSETAQSCLLEAFTPPDRLASAFAAAAAEAERRTLHSVTEPALSRWGCARCGFLNFTPPAIGFRASACFRCTHTNEE